MVAALGWQMLGEDEVSVIVYKTATCGCCAKWADMVAEAGFDVETKDVTRLGVIKAEHDLDRSLWSCHTAIVDGKYIVEGHVPIDQIKRLVAEQPEIRGIAVPGMPQGSPGMESPNPEPYDVLSFDEEGNTAVYHSVTL